MEKFEEGMAVSYSPSCAPAIKMDDTVVAGFQGVMENKWKSAYCSKSNDYRPKRQKSGAKENVYVIEHMYGWLPTDQKTLNPDLDLDQSTRYYFAYESELAHL